VNHPIIGEPLDNLPLETREGNPDDQLAAVVQGVEDLRTAATEHRSQLDERLTTETRAIGERLTALETRLNRPGTQEQRQDGPPIEVRAFSNFMRTGAERMEQDEIRALAVSSDTAGGYLATEEFIRDLDRNLVLFSPIRTAARVSAASAGEIILPKRTGTMTATWGGELTPAEATQPAYGQQKISIFELKCYVDISNTLLEDSAFDMARELAFDFAEEFGRAEGAAFINGDGNGKPEGLLNTAGLEGIVTPTPFDTEVLANDLINLYHALPGAYAARAVWAMNRTTIGMVRKLRNMAGDYLWTDSLTEGNPPTILGRPVVEFPDMPDAATGAVPIVFGDFGSGFRIFDRVNLSVLRDPYSQQVNGLVRFHGRRRVGGGVTKAEAFRTLTVG
jgi:HK97 family phage major capsid protein